MCRSKQFPRPPTNKEHSARQRAKKTYHIQDDKQSPEDADSSDGEFKLHNLGKQSFDPIMVPMILNRKTLNMEVDTGAALSVISEATRQALFPIKPCPL